MRPGWRRQGRTSVGCPQCAQRLLSLKDWHVHGVVGQPGGIGRQEAGGGGVGRPSSCAGKAVGVWGHHKVATTWRRINNKDGNDDEVNDDDGDINNGGGVSD